MSILSGLARPGDPIDTDRLSDKVTADIGKPTKVWVEKDQAYAGGQSISEADRTAIQNSINNYTYVGPGQVQPSTIVQTVNGRTGTVTLTPDDLDDTSTAKKFVTATDKTAISKTSGVNTGDQDLSGKANTVHAHVVTRADVGLGSVDNTADSAKPVSTATQTALNAKADTTALSAYATTTALTNGLATKEPTIPTGTAAQYLRGDKALATLDKTAVGLGSVDNTSDANKPVSTATQSALNAKAAGPTFTALPNGTLAMAFGTNTAVTVTPTATATFTTSVPPAGQVRHLIILTAGVVSFTITFGTGFKPTATLATGATAARVFVLSFISDGTNLYEASRTVAMVA
jgi:hypothetical protein